MPGNGQWMLSIVSHWFFYYAEVCYSLPPFANLFKVTGCSRGEKHSTTFIKEGFQGSRGRSYCSSGKDKWDSLVFPWDGQVAAGGGCSPKEGERRAATRRARQWPQQQGTVPWHQRRVSRAERRLQQVLLTVWWASGKEEATGQVQGESKIPKQWFRYRARVKCT